MADIREQILARLQVVALSVAGVETVLRNSMGTSDIKRPAILILDADEIANENDPNSRPVNSPRRVTMSPEIYIMIGGKPETVGSSLNAMRGNLIKAVIQDTELIGLTADDKGIRYVGCLSAFALGRSMEGQMSISFDFEYFLRPDNL